MIKIVIIDDHQIFLEGLMAMCNYLKEIEVVGWGNNVPDGYKTIEKHQPDVAIIDINMENENGIDLVRMVSKNFPYIKIGMLTMYNSGTFIQEALDAGASGYLLKNVNKDEFETGIKAIAAGKKYFSGDALDTFIQNRNSASEEKLVEISLSSREAEVLQLISKGLTSKAIAEKLFISINTVKTHRKHLLEKLKVNNTAELIKSAIEHHLIDEEISF